jgi:hypothetical protein
MQLWEISPADPGFAPWAVHTIDGAPLRIIARQPRPDRAEE